MRSSWLEGRVAGCLTALGAGGWALLLFLVPYAAAEPGGSDARGIVAAAVDAVGRTVCHQRPPRSFHIGGSQVPVCARCAGLYWAVPFGFAAAWRRRPHGRGAASTGVHLSRVRGVLIVSTFPTLATIGIEWLNLAQLSNAVRAVAAIPLGLALAWVVGLFFVGALRDSAPPVPLANPR